MGWGGVVVVCLIIVSTPVPDFVKVKARFVQFGLANRLAMSRTRLVKARARSLTISQPKLHQIEHVGSVWESSGRADSKTAHG